MAGMRKFIAAIATGARMIRVFAPHARADPLLIR
jgi:hypothetical protein